MEDHAKRLGRLEVEFGNFIEQAGQLVFMRRPSLCAKPGPNFEHDCVNHRVTIEDVEDAREITGIDAAANGAAGIKRVAITAADNIEKAFEFVVRGVGK